MELNIVIPAYNEEKRIEKTLKNYSKFFDNKKIKYELIVVCNGCIDNTVNIVKDFIKKNKNIKLLEYKDTIGKGGAILEGFKKTKGDIVGFLDADGSFDLEEIYNKLIKNLDKYDCVIASKWKNQKFSNVTENKQRKILSRGWNFLGRIFFNFKFKDTQAGAKFLTKDILNKMDLNFICKGFEFDIEFLLKLKKINAKIKEVYCLTKDVQYSTFDIKYIPSMFYNLFKLWWHNR